jgi:hypothetical protein
MNDVGWLGKPKGLLQVTRERGFVVRTQERRVLHRLQKRVHASPGDGASSRNQGGFHSEVSCRDCREGIEYRGVFVASLERILQKETTSAEAV